jgi:hypothetical protein
LTIYNGDHRRRSLDVLQQSDLTERLSFFQAYGGWCNFDFDFARHDEIHGNAVMYDREMRGDTKRGAEGG